MERAKTPREQRKLSTGDGASLKRLAVPLIFVVAVLGLAYVVAVWSGLAGWLSDEESLSAWFRSLGLRGAALVIAVVALAVVVSPLPSAPVAIAAGMVYGPTAGTVLIVLGAGLGSIVAFLIARYAGYDLVHRALPKGRLYDFLHRQRSQTVLMVIVFVSRLVPFLSFDAVSYAAGLTPLAFWRFVIATFTGVVPIAFLLVYVGSDLAEGGSWLAAGLVLVLAVTSAAPFLWAVLRGRRRPDPENQ